MQEREEGEKELDSVAVLMRCPASELYLLSHRVNLHPEHSPFSANTFSIDSFSMVNKKE